MPVSLLYRVYDCFGVHLDLVGVFTTPEKARGYAERKGLQVFTPPEDSETFPLDDALDQHIILSTEPDPQ